MDKSIKHPQGNLLVLSFPVVRRQTTTVNGKQETVETDFILDGTTTVRLTKGFHSYDYTPEIEGNVVTFSDQGTLSVGEYDITVLHNARDGQPYKWKHRQALCIVDATADGGIYKSAVIDTQADYISVVKRISAIVIDEHGVTVNESGYYGQDEDPTDDFADANAHFGKGKVEIDENFVTLNI